MAKNKPKNTEHDLKSELHKKPAKPVTKPAVNQKTQQKKKKKKKPNEEKRNQQRIEVQRFIGAVNRLKKQIRLPRYSIFQTIDIKIVTKMLKKDVRRVIVVQPVLKDCSLGYVKPMEYRYDNTWTVDMVKKDIATAIFTPKYSLTLSEDAEMNLKISRRILATSVVQLGGFLINKNIVYACSGNEPVTASYHDF